MANLDSVIQRLSQAKAVLIAPMTINAAAATQSTAGQIVPATGDAAQADNQAEASHVNNVTLAQQGFGGEADIRPPVVHTPGDLLSSLDNVTDAEFQALVDQGSIAQADGRQTHYFQTHAEPGDGVIATEFVIQADVSGGFLEGDGREITDDPLGLDPNTHNYDLNESRMLLVIDRETGRGVVTSSPSSATIPVDLGFNPGFIWNPINQNPIGPPTLNNPFTLDNEVGSRPIVLGPGNDSNWEIEDLVHNQYFNIEADGDNIRIDYDAVNSVTAPFHHISVDGPIVLERGSDGSFVAAGDNSPDQYPSISVVQYHPDGSRTIAFQQTEKNVFEGASPPPVAEGFEAIREISEEPREHFREVSREVSEGWREVDEAPWYRVPDQLGEAAFEVGYEHLEGSVETAVDVPLEILEGGFEVGREGVKSLFGID